MKLEQSKKLHFLLLTTMVFLICSCVSEKEPEPESQPQVEKKNIINEQFADIEKSFSSEEGDVVREENAIIIRLTGLKFIIGETDIEKMNRPLLEKIKTAINKFPSSRILLEGYTDSQGAEDLNLKLSQERADALKDYLISKMSIEPTRIKAVGYGEAKPIADNQTPEGRAQNRRIHIIIYPE